MLLLPKQSVQLAGEADEYEFEEETIIWPLYIVIALLA